MGPLVLLELHGDREQLLAAIDYLGRRLHRPKGLLLRLVAPTDQGVLLIQLWASREARAAWNDDEQHQQALRDSGVLAAATHRESRVLEPHEVSLLSPGD